MSEEAKTARIASGTPREKSVPLEWPIEFDGKTWTDVMIRRVSGKEIEDYMTALSQGERPIPPMFDFPIEVYDAMDDDDRYAVDEAVVPFLPRRLKVAAEQALPAGDPTSDS